MKRNTHAVALSNLRWHRPAKSSRRGSDVARTIRQRRQPINYSGRVIGHIFDTVRAMDPRDRDDERVLHTRFAAFAVGLFVLGYIISGTLEHMLAAPFIH